MALVLTHAAFCVNHGDTVGLCFLGPSDFVWVHLCNPQYGKKG